MSALPTGSIAAAGTIPVAEAAPDTPVRWPAGGVLVVRAAEPRDAPALHALISAYTAEGRLLPRAPDDLAIHAPRFVVADHDGDLAACAELAPLSARTAEVRSLVVHRAARGRGLGRHLIARLERAARLAGFEQLCAFTHEPAWFLRQGFALVPHTWLPEKIAADCHRCPLFRACGQHAVVLPLGAPRAR